MDNNEELLRSLIHEFGDDILRLCIVYMQDYHLAEDAWQETFFRVYRNLNRLEEIQSVKSWMCKIAINTCKSILRKTAYRKNSLIDFDVLIGSDCSEIDICENRLTISNAIAKLSLKLKEVIVLYYLQDFSVKDIASILGVSTGTVLVRLQRAREKLKGILKEDYLS